jgi:tRNA threonylcarbamoyladenosine biosynthesis protein TsaE
LAGELGAGKTTFTKGLATGLGVKRAVTSPTFTIIKEYNGKLPLYHMDAYRLEHSDEDIGFEEYFYGDGISVIEWAHFIEEFLPKERLQIEIKQQSDQMREILCTANSTHYQRLLENLAAKEGNKS